MNMIHPMRGSAYGWGNEDGEPMHLPNCDFYGMDGEHGVPPTTDGFCRDDCCLFEVPGAEVRYDDEGRPIVEVATCGTCGRSWNDAAVSAVTPAPSGRCPFEHEHEGES